MNVAAANRSASTESSSGPWKHTFGVLILATLMMGKNSSLSAGSVHVRSALPPNSAPARNHTGPRCPDMQSAPVRSASGFAGVGIERAHCHHSALNRLSSPWGATLSKELEFGSAPLEGATRHRPTATTAATCFV